MQHQNQQQLHDTTSQPGAPVGGGGGGGGSIYSLPGRMGANNVIEDFKIGKVKLIWS